MPVKKKAPKKFKMKKEAPQEVVVETVETLVEVSDIETTEPKTASENPSREPQEKVDAPQEKIDLEELSEKSETESKEEIEETDESKEKVESDLSGLKEETPQPEKSENQKEEKEISEPIDKDKLDLDDKNDKKNGKKFVIGVGIIVGLLAASGVLIYLMFQPQNSEKPKEEAVIEKPTPTPKKIVREDWTFEVLNGSGIAGLASKKAKLLEETGYKVTKTGNADNQNYETTELYVSEDMSDQADLLIQDLKTNFNITEVKGNLSDSTANVRIIIGKDSE